MRMNQGGESIEKSKPKPSKALAGAAFTLLPRDGLRLWPRRDWPLVLQMEAAECGLACLAMVAQHFGMNAELADLRARFAVSSRGTSLQELAQWADALGLNARSLELGAEEIAQLKFPAALHWAGNHWVLALKATRTGLLIHDPAQGRRQVSWAEVGSKFGGYAADFVPRTRLERTPPQPRLQFGTLLASFPGLKKTALQLMLVSAVLEIIALLMPYYSQMVMDHVLVTGDQDLLTILALAACGLLVFQTAFTALRGWAGVLLAQSVGYQLYSHVMGHLLKLPIAFFVKRQTGDLISRFQSLEQLAHSLTRTSIEVSLDALIGLSTLAMMFLYAPTLAWISLAVFVLSILVKFWVFGSSQRITGERVYLDAKRQSHMLESLRGIHAVKMAGAQVARAQQWSSLTQRVMDKDASTERINLGSQLAMSASNGLAHLLIIYLAALLILQRQMSVGMLFAFLAYQGNFLGRAGAFVDRMLWLRTMRVHFGRIGDIVFTPIEPMAIATPGQAATQFAPSQLLAKEIGFQYTSADPMIFANVSLQVQAGEMIALVGPSGCGKTTLLCVLGGVFQPSHGELGIDGIKLTAATATQLRQRMAFVFQSDELFEGSIEENISFFSERPDRTRIRYCAEMACIASEIEQLPLGYRTRLAEQGAGISGGQRQRLLLARALYRAPSLLILDEATSQLDVETERKILDNLRQLRITIIMSAHRPDAIARVDRVFSLLSKDWIHKPLV